VDKNLNNSPNDFLWSLLENPANDANSHVYNLRRLVDDFPQSGILQALLAHASDEKNLKRASAYFNPRALFKLINTPSALTGVPAERIIIQPGISVNGSYHQSAPPAYEESNNTYTGEDLVVDKSAPPVEADEEQGSHHAGEELLVDPNATEYLSHITGEEHAVEPVTAEAGIPATEHQTEESVAAAREPSHGQIEEAATEHEAAPVHIEPAHEDEVTALDETALKEEEIEPQGDYRAPGVPEAAAEETAAQVEEQPSEEVAGEHAIHDHSGYSDVAGEEHLPVHETYEPVPVIDLAEEKAPEILPEIPVEEDIKPQSEISAGEEHIPEPEIPVRHEPIAVPEAAADEADEIYDEIVGIEDINLGEQRKSQFFTFDQEFGAHENQETKEQEPAQAAPATCEPEQQDISRYHDEKMPYTFMWWLDKTRKEHAQIYQPYVKPPAAPKKAKKITDELQQQYFENIFHITSVEELDKSAPPPLASPDFKRKDQVIIERFIKEEPQIKPQSSDKLDNENKAKKSSEDRDELVSETLAAIYSDQMLYHKAIASYKKLMLKFPEKSRYFAEKIETLEKKTN